MSVLERKQQRDILAALVNGNSERAVEEMTRANRRTIGRMRRLVLAFSKRPEHHRAAVALNYVHYNLCHIPRTTRITPAMGVGIVNGPWSIEELLDALLSAEPCDAPGALPLAFRAPAETSRALPNNRGFLRALPGGKGAPPAPRPEAPPPTVAAAPVAAPAEDDPQLDLLAWRPRAKPLPPIGSQIEMFPEDDR